MEKDRNSVTIMLIRLNKKYKTEEIGSMAIGWERGFIIEKDETSRKYVNCKDCFYCDKEDKSCSKNNIYIPDIGYDYWKQCKYFVIDSQANDSKKIQAFKKKGVNVLKREKIKNPQDIYSIRKGSNYHFHNMRREYKEVFYSMYKKKNDIDIIKCYELLPLEVYDGYTETILSGNNQHFLQSIALFMNNLEMVQCLGGIKKIAKKTMPVVGKYILYSDKIITREIFEEMFLEVFCKYLEERGAFDELEEMEK